MREIFVLPAERRARTGGNLYNRNLIAALTEHGADIATMTLEQATRHARTARPARYWIDMLLMDRVRSLREATSVDSRVFLIVHWYPSLQPALASRQRASLRRREAAAFAAVQGFLVTSRWSAKELAKRGVRRKPVLLVPPAPVVTPSRFIPRDPATLRAAMVAHVIPGKGILELLRTLAACMPRASEFSLEIAGSMEVDPAYAARCRAVSERPALHGKVRFAGALDARALARLYERNAFFVSASHMETFGMALQEASGFGLYLMVLDAGNTASHVRRGAGEIFDSIEALAERFCELAREPEERSRLLRRMPAPSPAPTWPDAARRFLAQRPRGSTA